jgi:hypothetical protein
VGIGKKKYLVEELGPGTVELMKKIKRTIDPLGLFNPGKVSSVPVVFGFRLFTPSQALSRLRIYLSSFWVLAV